MALPQKGLRTLLVNDQTYKWFVKPVNRSICKYLCVTIVPEGNHDLKLQFADSSIAFIAGERVVKIIASQDVKTMIQIANELGWSTKKSGVFGLKSDGKGGYSRKLHARNPSDFKQFPDLTSYERPEEPYYGTARGLDKILGVPWEGWMQDWPVEVIHSEHLAELVEHYPKENETDRKYVLMLAIIEAIRMTPEKEHDQILYYFPQIRTFLQNDYAIHEYHIYYWVKYLSKEEWYLRYPMSLINDLMLELFAFIVITKSRETI